MAVHHGLGPALPAWDEGSYSPAHQSGPVHDPAVTPDAMPPSSDVRLVSLAHRPRLFVVDGFLAPETIEELLARGRDPATWKGSTTKHDDTGFSFEWPVAGDAVLAPLARRIQTLFKMGDDPLPTFRFRRYGPGEGHPPHLDNYRIGDRFLLLTALVYLEEPSRGGETWFERAEPGPVAVRPRRGRLAAWLSHRPDGRVEECSWHEGRAIEAGTKTTITAFVYRPLAYAARRIEGVPPVERPTGEDGMRVF